MSKYVIYKDQGLLDSGQATAHAIVIGVGDYPHLNGGSGNKTNLHGGLKQLSSPAESARAFTDWLLTEFNNPAKPLATVSLLISDTDDTTEYHHPKLAVPVIVEKANIGNVKKAVREWKAYGDKNEDNLVMFFFCGHGVARGLDWLTLLLSDYGESDDIPMEGALDFTAFRRGMAQCKASEQCYFIDSCRKTSDIATRTTETGTSIVQDSQNRPDSYADLKYAVFYSTLGGEAAYGRKNKPSYYTEELIKGLNGTGSNNRNGDGKWRVSTSELNMAIHWGLSLLGEKIKVPMSTLVQFEFHELLHEPVVPVTIYCEPRTDNRLATFSCNQNEHTVETRGPDETDWLVDIPHGRYDFLAQIDARKGERKDESIMPPYREIKIEVTP